MRTLSLFDRVKFKQADDLTETIYQGELVVHPEGIAKPALVVISWTEPSGHSTSIVQTLKNFYEMLEYSEVIEYIPITPEQTPNLIEEGKRQ